MLKILKRIFKDYTVDDCNDKKKDEVIHPLVFFCGDGIRSCKNFIILL
jgi:hypothetical protein